MITKTDFIARVNKEILNKPKSKEEKKRLTRIIIYDHLLVLGAVFLFWQNANDKEMLYLILVAFFILLFLPTLRFCSWAREEKLKTLIHLLDMPAVEFCKDPAYAKQVDAAHLLPNLAKQDLIFQGEPPFTFDEPKATVSTLGVYYSRVRHENCCFHGVFIEIKLDSFYADPVVFSSKRWRNRRPGLNKVVFLGQDDRFDLFSNDEKAAKDLYFKQVAGKLLWIDKSLKVDRIDASFYQDRLYIALHTDNALFVYSRKKDAKIYETSYDKIAMLQKYCEQFKGF